MPHSKKQSGNLGQHSWHSDVLISLFTPPTHITDIPILDCLCGESWSPDDGRRLESRTLHSLCYSFFYYLSLVCCFLMYEVMWSINTPSNLIGFYMIQIINVNVPGMLAQVTWLFFAVGRGNLGTRLIMHALHYVISTFIAPPCATLKHIL